MADSELENIRAKRLAEMQQMQADGPNENTGKEAEMRAQQADMKNQILSQVLDQKARARLNTILLAKPEKGQMVENMLINMLRNGQVMGRLSEDELISLLGQLNEHTQKKTSVKFDRRRAALEDSDED